MIKTLGAIGGATALLTLAAPALAQSVAPSEAGETRTPATPIVTAYPAAADGDGATTNGFNVSRWAEDWRGLRDPAKREDVFDRLKFLPLAADGAVYLTLSGELRLRVNHTTNPNLRETRAQRTSTASSAVRICTSARMFAPSPRSHMAASPGSRSAPLPRTCATTWCCHRRSSKGMST